MNRHVIFAVVFAVLFFFSCIWAGVPQMMNYQGRLTDINGSDVNGSFNMLFSIYNAPMGGDLLWQEVHSDLQGNPVTVRNGLFNLILGESNPIPDDVFDGQEKWLGIKVGSDLEIVPRTSLITMPYAFRVNTVDGASGGVINSNVFVQGLVAVGMAETDSAFLSIDGGDTDTLAIWALKGDGWPVLIAQKTGNGNAVNILKEGDPGYGLWIVQSGIGAALVIDSNTTESATSLFRVESDGKVGIGTNNPTEPLEVSGIIFAESGGFKFPDGSIQTTAAEMGLFPSPAYNSGWVEAPHGTKILNHNLEGDPNDYLVDLQFKDIDNDLGLNAKYYGGMYFGSGWAGACYENLTATSISVYRHPSDAVADSIRVRIWITQ